MARHLPDSRTYQHRVLYTFEDGSQLRTATQTTKRVRRLPREARNRGNLILLDIEEEFKQTIYYGTRKYILIAKQPVLLWLCFFRVYYS